MSVQREQGPKRRQIHELNRRILRELAREILGEGSRLRQITCEGERERRGIVHFAAAPSELERLGGALPGCSRIPVKRFPHRSGRFEQAGPLTSTRPLRDLDRDRGHPSRILQAAGASQGERLQMRDDVFRGAVLPGLFRRPSELVVGALQEGDEIGNQEKLGRNSGCAPSRDRPSTTASSGRFRRS